MRTREIAILIVSYVNRPSHTALCPAHEAIVGRRRRPVFQQAVAPPASTLECMQNAADDAAVAHTVLAAHVCRQIRHDLPSMALSQPASMALVDKHHQIGRGPCIVLFAATPACRLLARHGAQDRIGVFQPCQLFSCGQAVFQRVLIAFGRTRTLRPTMQPTARSARFRLGWARAMSCPRAADGWIFFAQLQLSEPAFLTILAIAKGETHASSWVFAGGKTSDFFFTGTAPT